MSTERPHGTYGRYKDGGCRCDECRTYQNTRVARNRADRKARGAVSHGTRSGYDTGCRCEQCREARREAYRRLPSDYPQRSKR